MCCLSVWHTWLNNGRCKSKSNSLIELLWTASLLADFGYVPSMFYQYAYSWSCPFKSYAIIRIVMSTWVSSTWFCHVATLWKDQQSIGSRNQKGACKREVCHATQRGNLTIELNSGQNTLSEESKKRNLKRAKGFWNIFYHVTQQGRKVWANYFIPSPETQPL